MSSHSSDLIHTSRLLIRRVRTSEAPQYGAINELRGNERDLADTIQGWNSRGALQLFVILKGGQGSRDLTVREGVVVGFTQILAERNDLSEVSFRTHPSAYRRGYMKEALIGVFGWCFDMLHRRDLLIETRSDNHAVIGLMRSLGLHGKRGSSWRESGIESVTYTFGRYTWLYR